MRWSISSTPVLKAGLLPGLATRNSWKNWKSLRPLLSFCSSLYLQYKGRLIHPWIYLFSRSCHTTYSLPYIDWKSPKETKKVMLKEVRSSKQHPWTTDHIGTEEVHNGLKYLLKEYLHFNKKNLITRKLKGSPRWEQCCIIFDWLNKFWFLFAVMLVGLALISAAESN